MRSETPPPEVPFPSDRGGQTRGPRKAARDRMEWLAEENKNRAEPSPLRGCISEYSGRSCAGKFMRVLDPAGDKTYVALLVASRTGTRVIAKAKLPRRNLVRIADAARKAGAYLSSPLAYRC
jgi:hypothetical protein